MRGSVTARRVVACALSAAVLSACMRAEPAAESAVAGSGVAPAEPATAHPVAPDPRIGAVFPGGGDAHACSGAVLASRTGDLILTAAHCMADGVSTDFVPGFADDAGPDQIGHIDAVFLDPRWVRDQDPMADFAIVRVRFDDPARPFDVPGGGLRLGAAPAPGDVVTVTGYAAGFGGGPSSCRAPARLGRQGFPSLHCDGVVGGFSGAPWMTGSTVSGVIGGLDGGGCADEVSYSPPFDESVVTLLARAEAGGPGDTVPTVFDDGCG